MEKSKLYTGTGDKGQTALVGGKKVSKAHPRLEAYGTVDELNAHLGLLIAHLEEPSVKKLLLFVQHKLFNLGGYLATEHETPTKTLCQISKHDVERLEEALDQLDSELPPLQAFILPGGSPQAAQAHVCRTVCRRAERRMVQLTETGIYLEAAAVVFMNRLSDLLFVVARSENLRNGKSEIIWNNACI